MTFQGFPRYMESKDCSVLEERHEEVHQDMDQPLCQYLISSSHNTCPTGGQLVGGHRGATGGQLVGGPPGVRVRVGLGLG